MLSTCKIVLHTKTEKKNVNKNVTSKPFLFPGNGAKNLIGAELALKKCVFCEINEKLVCANVPSILPL